MKKAIIIALALCATLSFASCGKTENTDDTTTEKAVETAETEAASSDEVGVAGTYEGVHSKFVGADEWEEEPFSIVLNADGTGTFKRDDFEFDLNYTIDGEDFEMTEKFGKAINEYKGTLKDGELHIYTGGEPDDELAYEYVLVKAD